MVLFFIAEVSEWRWMWSTTRVRPIEVLKKIVTRAETRLGGNVTVLLVDNVLYVHWQEIMIWAMSGQFPKFNRSLLIFIWCPWMYWLAKIIPTLFYFPGPWTSEGFFFSSTTAIGGRPGHMRLLKCNLWYPCLVFRVTNLKPHAIYAICYRRFF